MIDFAMELEDGNRLTFRSSAITKVYLKSLESSRPSVPREWAVIVDGYRVFTGDLERAEIVHNAIQAVSGIEPRSLSDFVPPGTLP
jgi:hypothetical protein